MALERHILTITEPTIKLDPIDIPDQGESETGDKHSIVPAAKTPYIKINGHVFQPAAVISMRLSSSGKYPELTCRLRDQMGIFTIDQFPRDGDVLSLRIAVDFDGTYKDLRMDFNIVEFRGNPTTTIEKREGEQVFNVRAVAKLPGLYTDECKSFGSGTSLDHIIQVAQDLQLGVATNVDATNDLMVRLCAYQTKLDFLDKTVQHAYISDDAFLTYSIDPFYYINFVELQKIFNSPNEVELTDLITSKIFKERGEDPDSTKNETALMLTNHQTFSGTANHIIRYNLINESTRVALENGYRRKIQYFDMTDGLLEFDVESLVSDNIKDNEEALKGRRNSETDEYNTHIKQKFVGIQTSNMHGNYMYSAINNIQNLVELDKMRLVVELAAPNPAIYRYMKVPVAIYNYGEYTKKMADDLAAAKEESGFDDANKKKDSEKTTDHKQTNTQTLDEFLSGYYIIIGIDYKFDQVAGFSQILHLARREWPARIDNI